MPLDGTQALSIVALVISSTALLWSTLQLIHAYLGSARGYSNINEEVMPGWVKFKRRSFLWGQFRFGVEYETPVFFVCSVKNKSYPIPSQTPLFIGDDRNESVLKELGKDDEWDVRWTKKKRRGEKVQLIPREKREDGNPVDREQAEGEVKASIHTINNDRATWINLLSALQSMETDSRKWEIEQHRINSPCPPLPRFESRTLAVAIQRKKRSWDNMPSSITKPYATTTLCHMMEMVAMLGLHWQEFDRANDNFLAEGNGYLLKSTSVSELGTVFTFQTCGGSRFEKDRIIPVEAVKDLAFGFVPTLYYEDNDVDQRRLTALSAHDLKKLKYLQMGSANELAETLVSLGCTTRVSELVRQKTTNQRHLYPLAFEVMGMLGKVLYLKNSFFRTLPNPTFYQWDARYFNMPKLLEAFRDKIRGNGALQLDRNNIQFQALQTVVMNVGTALDDKANEHSEHIADYLQRLYAALDTCDDNLKNKNPLANVQPILTKHIQVVLECLNPASPDTKIASSLIPEDDNGESAAAVARLRSAAAAFARLNAAPEDKEKQLINLYFEHVLPRVRGTQSNDNGSTFIWCTLVFRSLCWLALHDFHKNDRQPKGKSGLMGSRLPVYII